MIQLEDELNMVQATHIQENERANKLATTNQKMKDILKRTTADTDTVLEKDSHSPSESKKEKIQKMYTHMLNDTGKTC